MNIRKVLLIFCALSWQISLASEINLPNIGDAVGEITPAEEYRTGEAVIRNIRRAGGIFEDRIIHDYLNDLGYKLVAARETTQPFHFFLVNDTSLNAFALPGGFIGINAGLITASQSESELAGVMAHEIAHITQRHHARQYANSESNIPILAALIAAMILGEQDNDIGQAALATAAASSAQNQINFTRENEKEADRLGIERLKNAGFNPHSIADFFETLEKQSRLYGDSIPEFLRSHPVNPSRIADAKHRASQYPEIQAKNSLNYYLCRTRINVLFDEDSQSMENQLKLKLKKGNYLNKQATLYGYALTLKLNKKYNEALNAVETLVTNYPEQIMYQLLKANILTAAQDYVRAENTFKELLKLYPGNATINYYYADTLIKAGKIKPAYKVINEQISNETTRPEYYRLLAETESKLNKPASSHLALAEYYYLRGHTHNAIKQLELGLKEKDVGFYLTNRLEARLETFKNELHLLNSISNH